MTSDLRLSSWHVMVISGNRSDQFAWATASSVFGSESANRVLLGGIFQPILVLEIRPWGSEHPNAFSAFLWADHHNQYGMCLSKHHGSNHQTPVENGRNQPPGQLIKNHVMRGPFSSWALRARMLRMAGTVLRSAVHEHSARPPGRFARHQRTNRHHARGCRSRQRRLQDRRKSHAAVVISSRTRDAQHRAALQSALGCGSQHPGSSHCVPAEIR